MASGLLTQQDEGLVARYAQALNAVIIGGAALLMGTTSVQTLDPGLSVTVYTALLLGEGVAALLVGIALRSRVLVVAGAAGVALASLRALVLLIQQVPLFIVFGLVAILLLSGAAALAVLRERFADARVAMARSWRDWS